MAPARTSLLVVASCAITLLAGYLNKARCAGAPFDEWGRSLRFGELKDTQVCYSDVQMLWLGRLINEHVFPFVSGGITDGGQLIGGTVEYPVLSGLLMWLGAIGAHTDQAFLAHTALLLAPFGLGVAYLLARRVGWWALLWTLTPPLVLYAFHNWELPVVFCAVAAVSVMAMDRWSVRTRGVLAAVVLAVGFCLKIYPGLFVAPLALYVLTRGRPPARGRALDRAGAAWTVGAAVLTVIVINAPFMIAGYDGWRASFAFQSDRKADITTNSIWYWGLRDRMLEAGHSEDDYEAVVSWASPLAIAVAIALALGSGWLRYRRGEPYPWLAIGASMLAAFLVLHKVDSPQYTLWVLPLFALLRVPWPVIAAYLVTDVALGVGVFRYFAALGAGDADVEAWQHTVEFGVWGRAVTLVVLCVLFARATPRWTDAPAPRTMEAAPPPPRTIQGAR